MNVEELASQLAAGTTAGPMAFGIALLGGLVAGFGPCALPMVPAVFGYLTGAVGTEDAQGRRGRVYVRSISLAAVFVLGTSLLFAVIGAAAGLLGRTLILGPWAYYVVAAICMGLGLHMLGVIDIRFEALNRLLPIRRPERSGYLGALLFGMMFGVIASPCATPILAAIATIAAARGSAVEGGALLFVFGIGKGAPLLLLGIASGSLVLMGRMSRATGTLTKLGGAGLLFAAAYLVWLA